MHITVYIDTNRDLKEIDQRVQDTARHILRRHRDSLRSLHIHLQDSISENGQSGFYCRTIANILNSPPCILSSSGKDLEEVVTRVLFKVQNYLHGERTPESRPHGLNSPKEAA